MANEIIGGGSAPNLCNVSPSDMAGQLDNIITRLEKLEQAVAEISSANISANQLSDLSQNAGWITGITYMGQEGWTQTPSGTLIPPTGWTGLSDIIDGQEGGALGGAATFDIKSAYGTDAGNNIASGSSKYYTASGTWSYLSQIGSPAITYGSVEAGGKNGWVPDTQPSSYIVTAYADVMPGTSAPTTGTVTMVLYASKVGSASRQLLIQNRGNYPTGGGYGANTDCLLTCSGVFDIGEDEDRGFVTRFVNDTDGDVQVYGTYLHFMKVS